MRLAAVLLIALAAVQSPVPVSAQEQAVIRASCTQGGRTVYREDFPAGTPVEKRIHIAARNPGAMCVFLDVPAGGIPKRPAMEGSVPMDAGFGGDEGLATALSIIAEGNPGDPYPKAFAEGMSKLGGQEAKKPAENGKHFLNLTVGIYRGVPLSDVMAHWKAMQEGSKVLSKMTPTVNAVDGVTVVSVEGVPDELAVTLCEEAGVKGPGCVAVY